MTVRGVLLLLFTLCVGLSIYLYQLDMLVTLGLVMAASLFLGLFTFALLVETDEGVTATDAAETPADDGRTDPC